MDISWGLIAPLVILDLILITVALVSCIKDEETNGPKWVWMLVIITVNLLGPILYFLFGRKK